MSYRDPSDWAWAFVIACIGVCMVIDEWRHPDEHHGCACHFAPSAQDGGAP